MASALRHRHIAGARPSADRDRLAPGCPPANFLATNSTRLATPSSCKKGLRPLDHVRPVRMTRGQTAIGACKMATVPTPEKSSAAMMGPAGRRSPWPDKSRTARLARRSRARQSKTLMPKTCSKAGLPVSRLATRLAQGHQYCSDHDLDFLGKPRGRARSQRLARLASARTRRQPAPRKCRCCKARARSGGDAGPKAQATSPVARLVAGPAAACRAGRASPRHRPAPPRGRPRFACAADPRTTLDLSSGEPLVLVTVITLPVSGSAMRRVIADSNTLL